MRSAFVREVGNRFAQGGKARQRPAARSPQAPLQAQARWELPDLTASSGSPASRLMGSAPNCRARARRSGTESTASTRAAPSSRAPRMASRPTGPQPTTTTTGPPSPSPPPPLLSLAAAARAAMPALSAAKKPASSVWGMGCWGCTSTPCERHSQQCRATRLVPPQHSKAGPAFVPAAGPALARRTRAQDVAQQQALLV